MIDYSKEFLPTAEQPVVIYETFLEENQAQKLQQNNVDILKAFSNLHKMIDRDEYF